MSADFRWKQDASSHTQDRAKLRAKEMSTMKEMGVYLKYRYIYAVNKTGFIMDCMMKVYILLDI